MLDTAALGGGTAGTLWSADTDAPSCGASVAGLRAQPPRSRLWLNRTMLASLNGKIMDAAEAFVPITDDGLLRGDGVFEVVRLYGGVPYALREHLERMATSAANLRLPFDVEAFAVRGARTAGRRDRRRRHAADGLHARRRAGSSPSSRCPGYPETLALVSVRYAPTHVMDGIKSLSYGANMLATPHRARSRAADEALLVTPHGRVLEGPRQSFVARSTGRGSSRRRSTTTYSTRSPGDG